MKKIILLSFLEIVFMCGIKAQNYTFQVLSGTYSDLNNSTSLNQGQVWDDPTYTFQLGFDFEFFDTTVNTFFLTEVGSSLITDTSFQSGSTFILDYLVPFGADVIDRGFANNVSESNISYQLDGTIGSRVYKIEWKNVGFFADVDDDGISTDFVNFQLWLYEGSNNVEIHFGNSSVTQPLLSYDSGTGPVIFFANDFDIDNDTILGEFLYLKGNPSSPILVSDSIDFFGVFSGLNGTPTNGTIYRFSQGLVALKNSIRGREVLKAFPNPFQNEIQLDYQGDKSSIQSLELVDVFGNTILSKNEYMELMRLSNLPHGIYYLRLKTDSETIVKRLYKN